MLKILWNKCIYHLRGTPNINPSSLGSTMMAYVLDIPDDVDELRNKYTTPR